MRMYPYRVFISYSRKDKPLAERIVRHLERIGLRPMWDKDLRWAGDFPEELQDRVGFAHAFLPILTVAALERLWVHQEIGYAVGVGVPILPVVVGAMPEDFCGLLRNLNALCVRRDLHDLRQLLTADKVEKAVVQARISHATYEIAALPDDRAPMLARYANKVAALGKFGRVRQWGALTSFCVPDAPMDDPAWTEREGWAPRSEAYHRDQREERRALECHARRCGCDLIIDPSVAFKENGPGAREARLRTLMEFLRRMPDGKVRVAVEARTTPRNLLIVGDWFLAESITPHPQAGYFQTVCARHAPTVLRRIKEFDSHFARALERWPGRGSSRRRAIAAIEQAMDRPNESA